jgi:hypothetical protein
MVGLFKVSLGFIWGWFRVGFWIYVGLVCDVCGLFGFM